MQAQVEALLEALRATPPGPKTLLSAAALPDLAATIAVLPRAKHASFASALLQNVSVLAAAPADEPARRSAATIISLCLRDKKAPTPPDLLAAAKALVTSAADMTGAVARNAVAKVAEVFWSDGREGGDYLAPYAAVVLLERSLAAEVGGTSSVEDVKRVYALRDALCRHPGVDIRAYPLLSALLVRAATNALYLRVREGQRLIAKLVVSSDVAEEVHKALLSMLPFIRKSRAVAVGIVYVQAWKAGGLSGEEEFMPLLEDLLTKAVRAGRDPLATNLRTVLSSFHVNKKLTGMDQMLNKVYTPILFRALNAANGLVRRNSAIILADSFPIHDPAMSNAQLEALLDEQCQKLLFLLSDPMPLVRVSAVEGACRVLGLLWELVSPAFAEKMVHVMTSVLAFDKTSANVRASVCDGLRFMLENHSTHPLLSVALPRLANLLHDKSERVRISFLSLLLELKAKRIVSARYFDVVPLEDFLLRLPLDTPAVRSKIMLLLVSSFFPLERKNKTRSQISRSQVRACVEMVDQNPAAAVAFYNCVHMYIPPGPLVEFCIRIAEIAMDSGLKESKFEGEEATLKKSGKTGKKKAKARRRPREPSPESSKPEPSEKDREDCVPISGEHERKDLFFHIISTILQSIAPSLAKASNAELKDTVVDMFGGGSLQALLTARDNSQIVRLSCLRIASTLSMKDVAPIGTIWRAGMYSLLDTFACDPTEQGQDWIAGQLLAGFAWKESRFIADIFASLADASSAGRHSRSLSSKTSKRARRAEKPVTSSNPDVDIRTALRALTACASALVKDEELRALFVDVAEEEEAVPANCANEKKLPPCKRIVAATQRGALAAIDAALESEGGVQNDIEQGTALLRSLATSMQLSLLLSKPPLASAAQDALESLASRSQLHLLEVVQWASGQQTLSTAFSRGSVFGLSLANVVMTHAADGAGLGKLPQSVGARYLAQFVVRVSEEVKAHSKKLEKADGNQATLFFGLSTLTASYHLLQSLEGQVPSSHETPPRRDSASPKMRMDDVHNLVSAAANILATCTMKEDDPALSAMSNRVAELLRSFAFSDNQEVSRCDGVATTLGGVLGEVLEEAKELDDGTFPTSALVTLVSKSVIILAKNPPRGAPPDCALQLVSAILKALRRPCDLRFIRFTRVIADTILEEFHDTTTVPTGIREVCSLLADGINEAGQLEEDVESSPSAIAFAELRLKLEPIMADLVKLEPAPSELKTQDENSYSQALIHA